MSPTPHIRVEMLSNPQYLSGARELVSAVAKRLGFSDAACGQIALAVDEALCNVIRHGYERRFDRPIWVSIWPLDPVTGSPAGTAPTPSGGIKLVIEDQAKQIEPGCIKGRDLDDIKPGGLGVHIIREVMDEVVYEKRECGGMRLTMVKRLRPVGEHAAALTTTTPAGEAPARKTG